MDRRGRLGGTRVVLLGTIKLRLHDELRGTPLRLVLRRLGLRTVNQRTRLRTTIRTAADTTVDTMPLQPPAQPLHGNNRKRLLLHGLLAAVPRTATRVDTDTTADRATAAAKATAAVKPTPDKLRHGSHSSSTASRLHHLPATSHRLPHRKMCPRLHRLHVPRRFFCQRGPGGPGGTTYVRSRRRRS